jgi:hypothetical protein
MKFQVDNELCTVPLVAGFGLLICVPIALLIGEPKLALWLGIGVLAVPIVMILIIGCWSWDK